MILSELPKERWPQNASQYMTKLPERVLLGEGYLVQVYEEPGGVRRITVNSVKHQRGNWADGIAWDDLQAIKAACGFGGLDAVEVYPATEDVVNRFNMRHLFVFPSREAADQAIPFVWRKGASDEA